MVDDLREEEMGLYRCRVDFRTAQTRNTFVNVSLIGEEEQEIVFSVDLCPVASPYSPFYSTVTVD